MNSLMLDAALSYAALGVPVFPLWPVFADGSCACGDRFGSCAGPGKHPATRWRHGEEHELPTTDPERIRAWWGPGRQRDRVPSQLFGIGIPTGTVSGLFVVDLDNKPAANGIEALARLCEAHGALPAGPVVLTPSGGRHLFLRAPAGGGRTTASVVAPGIDTRGEGGMVAAVPSLHKSGRRYRWEASLASFHSDRLPDVPTWLVDLTAQRPPAAKAGCAGPSLRWSVPQDDAAATLAELLDSPYVTWMVDHAEEVSREAWRTLATNLYAACAGHQRLLDVAEHAWHAVSAADGVRYRQSHAARQWADAANSPPISFEHAEQHGAPAEVCGGEKNLVLEARGIARGSPTSSAFIEAALNFLIEAPGGLKAAAEERGVTTREVLLEEGYLEDTSGYAQGGAARRGDADEEEGPASPA